MTPPSSTETVPNWGTRRTMVNEATNSWERGSASRRVRPFTEVTLFKSKDPTPLTSGVMMSTKSPGENPLGSFTLTPVLPAPVVN